MWLSVAGEVGKGGGGEREYDAMAYSTEATLSFQALHVSSSSCNTELFVHPFMYK